MIEHNTARIIEALHFTPDDLPDYAARAFDFAMANPASMRLVAWFALESGLEKPASRAQAVAQQKQLIGLAQQRGIVTSAFPPGFLLTALLVLAAGWAAGSPFGSAMDPDAPEDQDTLRELIAAAIARLCQPWTKPA